MTQADLCWAIYSSQDYSLIATLCLLISKSMHVPDIAHLPSLTISYFRSFHYSLPDNACGGGNASSAARIGSWSETEGWSSWSLEKGKIT